VSFACLKGQTLLPPKYKNLKNIDHLWLILNDPFGPDEEVVVINFTSQKPYSDTTVVLGIGDHDYIDRPTVVSYVDAKIRKKSELTTLVAHGLVAEHSPASPQLLKKLQDGLGNSPHTKNGIFEFWDSLPK
jgi:hypothetical protein